MHSSGQLKLVSNSEQSNVFKPFPHRQAPVDRHDPFDPQAFDPLSRQPVYALFFYMSK